MKGRFLKMMLGAAVVALALGVAAWGQAITTVKGKVTDGSTPLAGIKLQLHNTENGSDYTLTTNQKGEFFSMGIALGAYRITLSKDGQLIWTQENVHVGLDEASNEFDFDLAKLRAAALSQPGQSQVTAEQLKKMEEAKKEKVTVEALNQKLAAAKAAEEAKDWHQAVTILTEATTMDPTRHQLWANLCLADLGDKQYDQAVTHCQKGIELAQQAPNPDPVNIAQYHNNLGQAYVNAGKTDQAVAEYASAAQSDPAGAAKYYFNLGAVLTNQSARQADQAARFKLIDQATEAFDKATAADPTYAEAYYQKAVNLLGKATLDKSNKMVAPPGTAEAFNKYLELEPTGPHADEVKGMLAYIGAEVQTTYGKQKTTKTKPK